MDSPVSPAPKKSAGKVPDRRHNRLGRSPNDDGGSEFDQIPIAFRAGDQAQTRKIVHRILAALQEVMP
ncbi:hypothetical protein [Methylocella silvestris]|uniref:hypothetical protein n=1 Tax=Methylocella silvestris TaxID=199596 RepID=UPI000C9BF212|nr:hypothetical protein [Methylocella silvestris]